MEIDQLELKLWPQVFNSEKQWYNKNQWLNLICTRLQKNPENDSISHSYSNILNVAIIVFLKMLSVTRYHQK